MRKIVFVITIITTLLSCESFFIEDISDEIVVALAPLNGAELNKGKIQFSWKSIDAADTYQVEIVTPYFSSVQKVIKEVEIEETSIDVNLEPGEYQWRVKAMNSEHETGFTISSFTVQ